MSGNDGNVKADKSIQAEEQKGQGDEPEYELEELFPIVVQLAAQYTGMESTSISYEKAEQLMGAVLYCIREAAACPRSAPEMGRIKAFSSPPSQEQGEKPTQEQLRAERPSARTSYQEGFALVTDKVRQAIAVYNQLMPEFDSYGNVSLADVMERGMPEFFKWYDPKFAPQYTLLTLDYPLLTGLSALTGIDCIYEFLLCIRREQEFLHLFDAGELFVLLQEYDENYRELPQNLCQMVLSALLCRFLIRKWESAGKGSKKAEQAQERGFFAQENRRMLFEEFWRSLQKWLTGASEHGWEWLKYLENARRELEVRLENRSDFSTFFADSVTVKQQG